MAHPAVILGWARSAVVPHGGAFRGLAAHELGAPVLRALLDRCGVPAEAVDLAVLGNALGAGGNPARMLVLAAGLPDRCAALTVDTQCCAGLDAVAVAAGLLASGQANVAVAGGVEAWSRAPIRLHRPREEGEPARSYERPAFAPDPARDPDLLQAAADHARHRGIGRAALEDYAVRAHQRAGEHAAGQEGEIVPVLGVTADAYPRPITLERAARMPLLKEALGSGMTAPGEAAASGVTAPNEATASGVTAPNEATASGVTASREAPAGGLTALLVSPRADGVALVLLATEAARVRLGLPARADWVGSLALGTAPERPFCGAAAAGRELLSRQGQVPGGLAAVEVHDAFAVQGLEFRMALGPGTPEPNRRGGGLARGHPIGASAAIALVRLLADLQADHPPGALGLTATAGAGGLGTAALVRRR